MDLSIIIPVYNSENILENLINKIHESFNKRSFSKNFEVILVNDFSHDQSWEKIKFLANKFVNVKGVCLSENYGQHNAIMAGLKECSGNIVITMDDDMQHPPESIMDIYNELIKGFDVCYVYYLNRQHPLWKRFVSWLNNLISSYLLNKPLKIYMSSFKGFKKSVLLEITKFQGSEVYLDGLILKATRNISMVYVQHFKRLHGNSNYNFKKLLSLWCNMAVNFPLHPIRSASFFGVIIKYLIIFYRKIFSKTKKNKKQYLIEEKTYK